MATFPDECVDLVVTSPPYNLGNSHHTGSRRIQAYNDDMPEQDYQEWQTDVINEVIRCLKPNGSIFYNHKNRIRGGLTISPLEWILPSKALLKQELIWYNGSQNFDKVRFYPVTERVYWLAKSTDTQFHNNIGHSEVFMPGDWYPQKTDGCHARQFPVKMVVDILSCFPKGMIVLDPFMGSGQTALGAVYTGCHYIGIDVSAEYCDIARERVRNEQAQLKLDL